MKKRLISVVLVLVMALSMTTTVFAADNWESEIDTVGVASVGGVYYHSLQDAVDAANGGVVKLLEEPKKAIAVDGSLTLDLNGFSATVNGGTLTLIDSGTDDGTEGGKVYGDFTVADRVTEKGAIRYVVLDGKDENGAYKTANAVRVKLTKVSIRPSAAGIYYSTEIKFNRNVADVGVETGVAVSTKDMPGTDFETEGENRWTVVAADKGANFSRIGTSCLVQNILSSEAGVSAEANAARGAINIFANSYVKLTVGDEKIVITAENVTPVVFSMKTVMKNFDTKLAAELTAYAEGTGELSNTGKNLLAFYETWQAPMSQTGWALTNLAKALTKKNAA